MSDYTFEREARTPYSESYSIEESGEPIGRVDLHFAPTSIVFATLCIPQDFDDDDLQDLIAEVDERLVLSSDAFRDDFVVTVWRGTSAGVYSEETDEEDDADDDGEDEEDAANGNGSRP